MQTIPLQNPVMANQISQDPAFSSIEQEVQHSRKTQAMKHNYTYTLSNSIVGQQTLPFNMVIEQGSDFQSLWLLMSAFSYDPNNASTFPAPNAGSVVDWAARGLSIAITDTRSGRELTSGYVPIELLGTPGYGNGMIMPFPFRYHFYRNSKIRFDVRNRDNANRTHYFEIALNGFKVFTPE